LTALSAEEQASFASLRAGDVELSMISLKTHGPPPPGALRFHIGIPEIDIDAVFADMLRFATDCVSASPCSHLD
jgi:hypothetical protein